MLKTISPGGCGISLATKLRQDVASSLIALSKDKVAASERPGNAVSLNITMQEELAARTNGMGWGIALKLSRNDESFKSIPERLDHEYCPGENNLFASQMLARDEKDLETLEKAVRTVTSAPSQLRIERSPRIIPGSVESTHNVLKDNKLYEVLFETFPQWEYRLVQAINYLNALESGPKIFCTSANGYRIFKGVGDYAAVLEEFPQILGYSADAALSQGRYPTNTKQGVLASQPHAAITFAHGRVIETVSAQNGEVTNQETIKMFLRSIAYFTIGRRTVGIDTRGKDGVATFLSRSDGEAIPNLINFLLSKGFSFSDVARILSGKMECPIHPCLGLSGPNAVVVFSTEGVMGLRDARRLRPLYSGLISDGENVFLAMASERAAITYAAEKHGLAVLTTWQIKSHFVLEKTYSLEDVLSQIPKENFEGKFFRQEKSVLFQGARQSPQQGTKSNSAGVAVVNFDVHQDSAHSSSDAMEDAIVHFDAREVREQVQKLNDDELFEQYTFDGDNGKFFRERKTYWDRAILRSMRQKIKQAIEEKISEGINEISVLVRVYNVQGERFLGVGLFNWLKKELPRLPKKLSVTWEVNGTPGNKLGWHASPSSTFIVRGHLGENCAVGSSGAQYYIHGGAGGAFAYACSGKTKAFVRDSVGDRCGVYSKGTKENRPLLMIGNTAGSWCGECMHSGDIIVLNSGKAEYAVGDGAGCGMEGESRIFIKGNFKGKLGKGLRARKPSEEEKKFLEEKINDFCACMQSSPKDLLASITGNEFTVIEKEKKKNNGDGILQNAAQNASEEKKPVFLEEPVFTRKMIRLIDFMAETGHMPKKGMGSPVQSISLNAYQITAPPTEKREEVDPHERVRLVLGGQYFQGTVRKRTEVVPETHGVVIGSMSYGALGEKPWKTLLKVANEFRVIMGTGEGGIPEGVEKNSINNFLMRQLSTARFGILTDDFASEYNYFEGLEKGGVVEIKVGQGAKPAVGGLMPEEKMVAPIALKRGIEEGTAANSPPTHHEVYSIEDVKELIEAVRILVGEGVHVAVKFAANNDLNAICIGLARGNANIINIAGGEGGTGAAGYVANHTGRPALDSVESANEALVEARLRKYVSLVVSGGIYDPVGVIKHMAYGATAVEMGTAILVALGCTGCQLCNTGKCPQGITTNDPNYAKNFNCERAERRLRNYFNALFEGINDALDQTAQRTLMMTIANRNLAIDNRNALRG